MSATREDVSASPTAWLAARVVLFLLLLGPSSCSQVTARHDFRGAPDATLLLGEYWRLAQIASSSGSVSRARAPFTLHFTADGMFGGGAGGNAYGGWYTATSAGTFQVRSSHTTLIGGPEAERAGEYHDRMLRAHSFEATVTDLRLYLPEGGFLHFRRVPRQ